MWDCGQTEGGRKEGSGGGAAYLVALDALKQAALLCEQLCVLLDDVHVHVEQSLLLLEEVVHRAVQLYHLQVIHDKSSMTSHP